MWKWDDVRVTYVSWFIPTSIALPILSSTLRLVCTHLVVKFLSRASEDADQRRHYECVAVSHDCALSSPPRTTISNLSYSHYQFTIYKSLSKALQGAVILRLFLGMLYLWIDSLCIIQDSASDWEASLVWEQAGAPRQGRGREARRR
jgi:hypothetical protein